MGKAVESVILNESALVLNKNWVAIDVTTVRGALVALYQRAARVVEPTDYSIHDFDSWASLRVDEDQPFVRTVSLRIRVPEIILLTRYGKVPRKTVTFSRRNLYRRDQYRCQYCGARPGTEELSIDHIVPRSRGGRSTWENCVLSCVRCNARKSNRILDETGLRLLRRPYKPKWTPYLHVPIGKRKTSWEQFISDSYWDVELLP